jgi:hypothetical protein
MERNIFKIRAASIAVAGALLIAAGNASAAVIITDTSTTVAIPGLTGFATSGDQMAGMTVTASFGSVSETLSWVTTGAGAGGVTGTGWSLTQSGDTFNTLSWSFTNSSAQLLTGLSLDGAPGLTVFDIDSGTAGGSTPGSAAGLDFATDLSEDSLVVANYSNALAVGAASAVGDIFHNLDVDFTGLTGGGTTASFLMTQDTDNDSRFGTVPAPATLALLGLGLAGIGYRRRGKQS